MCGLTGIFETRQKRAIDRKLLAAMNETQFHRGPDEGGIHVEDGLGLAHRRLSIIDRADGQQPLFNEDGSVVVVFNGEIYNFAELSTELQQLGHVFRTHSDTEVIVHAWESWGEDCVKRFRGMFAFALWDRNQGTLFLARDRLGIKPLYYSLLPDGQLLFASELKALKRHPGLRRELDALAIEDYFGFGYVPEPRSIYRDTHKLPPGHTLTLRFPQQNLPASKPYWDIPFEPLPAMSDDEAIDQLVMRLREAVDIRLVAEVPLGAFLSGGVDSSSIVAMMSGLSGDPVNTCSIAFGEADYDESDYAGTVAQRYATNHQVERVDPDDYSLLDKLAGLYDEPFADSSAMPTYRVCELAKKRVTVVLSGDGGDENLAGYRRYGRHLDDQARKRRLGPLRSLLATLGHLYPDMPGAPGFLNRRQGLLSMGQDPVTSFFEINSIMKHDVSRRLFSRDFVKRLQGYQAVEVTRAHAAAAPTDDTLALAQYLDLKTYLPGDILTKVDRASMAHALEVRVPLLDHKLVEWMSGLPTHFKRRAGEGKYLLKKAMEAYLPNDILYRPKKGFAVPLEQWFRGPLRAEVQRAFHSDALRASGVFDERRLDQIRDDHNAGRRSWSSEIWAVLMFEAFLRQEQSG